MFQFIIMYDHIRFVMIQIGSKVRDQRVIKYSHNVLSLGLTRQPSTILLINHFHHKTIIDVSTDGQSFWLYKFVLDFSHTKGRYLYMQGRGAKVLGAQTKLYLMLDPSK